MSNLNNLIDSVLYQKEKEIKKLISMCNNIEFHNLITITAHSRKVEKELFGRILSLSSIIDWPNSLCRAVPHSSKLNFYLGIAKYFDRSPLMIRFGYSFWGCMVLKIFIASSNNSSDPENWPFQITSPSDTIWTDWILWYPLSLVCSK